jgi:rod shape-determining protein MreC
MQKKKVFFPVVILFLFFSLLIFFLSRQGIVQSLPFLNSMFVPLQRGVFATTQKMLPENKQETASQEKNSTIAQASLQLKKLQEDNAALRDQFETMGIPPRHLVPAHIVGEPGFIPGKTAIEEITIDQGEQSGIKSGMVVVYKNNVVGTVGKTTQHFSQVFVVSNKTISFSGKTFTTNALGVVKGQGSGDILLDNVLLSQNLKMNDIVKTSGDIDIQGHGYPQDLVVGKIVGIEKDPSALFQKADVASLVDITKLSMVFVIKITN